MKALRELVRRNCKLFFKDKGMFFTSLITPVILLVLYVSFLAKVYRDSITSFIPAGMELGDKVIDAFVGGQLISSLLAVSCVTVSFCSNLLMVRDKLSGAWDDINVSPVRRSTVALGYFFAAAATTLIVSFFALAVGLVYIAASGWYFSVGDVLGLIGGTVLLTLFGVALSSCINFPLKTQGQASAVGTIVSSGYGFICGAYMAISNFPDGLQKVLLFLPGTYGTSLLRTHALSGALAEMSAQGVPGEFIDALKKAFDYDLSFFDIRVSLGAKYAVLGISTALLIGVYVLLNTLTNRKAR